MASSQVLGSDTCNSYGHAWQNRSFMLPINHPLEPGRPWWKEAINLVTFYQLNIEAETKWMPFRRRHVQVHFLNENVWIPIEISLKFVPKGSINNNPALFQIMAWRRPGDKPLSEPMMVSSLMHICVTGPQWVNQCLINIRHWLNSLRQSDAYMCQ